MNIGVDIGGTKMAACLVGVDGSTHNVTHRNTPTDASVLTSVVVELIRDLQEAHPAAAVGVAVAGLVDVRRGVVVYAPNLAWSNEPLRDTLEARTGTSVWIENDANAAAWGEHRFGAGQGHTDLVVITVGTGIGGAIIMDGSLRHGGFGSAGEFGHTRYVRDGRPCGCGQLGCVEQYASGRALQREIKDIEQHHHIGAVLAKARTENPRGAADRRVFADLVHRKDPGALEALRRVGTVIGEMCAGIQSTLDPTMFLVGGGVADLGEFLLQPIRNGYEAALPAAATRPRALFATAECGNIAGAIGAADLAARSHLTGFAPLS